MRFFLFFTLFLFSAFYSFGQSTLPLTRTDWNTTTTGWTDSGSSPYQSAFACSGNNMGKIDGGESYIVNFTGAPGSLTFKLKNAGLGVGSELTISESSDGISYTSVNSYTTSNFTTCDDNMLTLNEVSRYVKFEYTTDNGGNFGIDDVSILLSPNSANILLSSISGNTTESGGTATFDVTLNTEPTTNVVLNIISGNTNENTVSVASLTFTNADWNIGQTVTITGVDDAIVDGDQTTTITLATDDAVSDDDYDGLSQSIDVVNEDDECSISNITATVLSCNGDNAEFVVSWTAINATNTIEVDINNHGYQIISNGGTYVMTGPTTVVLGATVTVRDLNESTCMATSTVDIPECPTNLFCESFDNGMAPVGWQNFGLGSYGTGNNAAKSLKFDTTGDSLLTPYSSNITELSFYIKGNSIDAASAFLVEGYDGINYSTIDNITNITNSYTLKSYTGLPNYSGIRFSYIKVGGNIAFDDLCIVADYVSASLLPVELVHFSAQKEEQTAVLKWITATEEDNSHFDIQRSVNGNDFETVGRVEGRGTTYNEQNYMFVDMNPVSGINYYRLRQVDFDGKSDYHSIVAVGIEMEEYEVAIVPMPVQQQFELVFDKQISEIINVEIYNINGQLIQKESVNTDDSYQMIDVANLDIGVYFARLNINNKVTVKRFVKL